MSDEEVVERVLRGETAAYATLMLRYQRRLQSILYPILRNDSEVEDAIQEGHTNALAHLGQFAGRSSFVTWMSRIMIHEAFGILRRRRRLRQLDASGSGEDGFGPALLTWRGRNPEQQAADRELRHALAHALNRLPEQYRSVFTLREIEELSTADAAGKLGISEECVRIRLHRARALLRRKLGRRGAGWSTHRASALAETEGFASRNASASRRTASRISRGPMAV